MTQTSSKESTAGVAEQISGLVDGFGDKDELNVAIDKACSDGDRHWAEYQMIGDALRSADLLESEVDSASFMQRMSEALEREPHLLIPDIKRRPHEGSRLLQAWRAIPAVAGLAATVVVGWVVVLQLGLIGGGEAVSVASSQKAAEAAQRERVQPVVSQLSALSELPRVRQDGDIPDGMIRDSQLDEYLHAHAQYDLQTVVPYVQNVSAVAREGCTASC